MIPARAIGRMLDREEVGDMPMSDARTEVQPAQPPEVPKQEVSPPKAAKDRAPASSRVPSIIVGLVVAAVAGLSVWYLLRGEPLLVQGEVDATRLDIAARVDGRVGEIPVERGQDVAAGAVLVRIDNPETIAKNEQAGHGALFQFAELFVAHGTMFLDATA